MVSRWPRFFLIIVIFLSASAVRAQDNYEIQVYPSETMAPKTLLVELHSNFTVEGSTTTSTACCQPSTRSTKRSS